MSTEKKTTQEEAVEAALKAVFGDDGVPKAGVCVDVIPDPIVGVISRQL